MLMSTQERVRVIAGWVLHVPVAGLMIFAGLGKLCGFTPPEVLEKMREYGLEGQVLLIGAGELTSALLLLIPRTSSLGLLLTSSFWGGVICTHMSHHESYALFAGLLLMTWAGAYLRNPATLSSFYGGRACSPSAPDVRNVSPAA
jgi:hypothetical protein